MKTLIELQQSLQAHVLDADHGIANDIDETPEVSADVRLGVYSDAYRLRLIEALETNYPALAKMFGAEGFSRMAQEYLLLHPSRHFSIRWFGDRLSGFLESYPDYRELPWYAELAKWEWSVATAFDAEDAQPLTVERLAQIAPDDWPQLRFAANPSLQRIALATNVVAIAKAAGAEEDLPSPRRNDCIVDWVIWRQALSVRFRSLATDESKALAALLSGATFEEICEVLAASAEAESVPMRAASLLKTWTAEEMLAGCSIR